MQEINPAQVRFIKLGEGGEWEASSIADGVIRLGYHSPHHQDSLNRNWDVIRQFWLIARKGNQGATTNSVNQIRDFYELDEHCLWITFYKKRLYWCFADTKVEELPDLSRVRDVIGQWSSCDIYGKPLRVENIDGRVTKVQGYRGTICSVEMQDYLIRKINGHTIDEVQTAKDSLQRLRGEVEELIKGLWWHDFELLIDLIFSKSGWQRFSVLGKTEKDIDLDVYSPATQKRAFVQIKSSTSKTDFELYLKSYDEYEQFDEMYFIYHTCREDLASTLGERKDIHLWDLSRIARLVVNSGLVEWLINKRS
ncbi:hypothetical protein PPUJ13061_51680 [Pseudomonas putida]|uniref:restriction endonuclease n=1 Tax=Pseudomonas putida TaxID=303 RepID=UPI000E0DE429|nr:restriction endonuclease [Pseudomonas putida]WQE52745.1 hypothetical protein U0028_23150 [Pseudomonas putida]GLO05266.1 hypothetical protein PPUJ13061_51680 [Pseudomonas putida]HDS1009313.1 hypothetical protein [Pseudomonas putida]